MTIETQKLSDKNHSDLTELKPSSINGLDYSVIFNAASNGMSFTECITARILDVNAAWIRSTGIARENAIGKTGSELGLWADQAERESCLLELEKRGRFADREVMLIIKSMKRPHLVSAETVEMCDRQCILWEFRDITEQKRITEGLTQSRRTLLSILEDEKQAKDALRESKWRLESIIEGTHVGTWEWNVQKGETVFNEIWAQLIGYTLDELAPISIKTWESFAHPNDLKKSAELLERHFAGELPYYDFECRMKHKNGQWIWVHDRGRVITRTSDGKPLMMFGTHTDITNRKLAEESRFESLSRFAGFAEASQYGMGMADLDGNIIFANSTLIKMLGEKSEQDCLGKHFPTTYYSQSMARKLQEEVMPALMRDGQWHGELELHTVDGRSLPTDENYFVIRDEQGRPRYLADILTDITERKRTERALQESEEKYRTVIETTDTGFVALDEKGQVLNANLNYANMLGYSSVDKIIGRQVTEWTAPYDLERNRTEISKCFKDGSVKNLEIDYKRTDGTIVPIEINATVLQTKNGKIILTICRDITGRKQAENKVQKSEAMFRTLFNNTKDTIFVMGIEEDGNTTNFKLVNDAACINLGYTREELLQLSPNAIDVIGLARQVPSFGEKLLREKHLLFESKHIAKDGHTFPVEVSLNLFQLDGKPVNIAIVRDITERKQAQEALQISETRFRELYNNMSSGVAVYEAVDEGTDFVFRDLNAASQKMEKTSRENVIGRRVTEVFPGVKAMGLLEVFNRVWKTGKPEHHPTALYKDNRLSSWRENYIYKLPSGEIVAAYDDVTERQAALEQLKEERNLLRTLIDHIPDGIYVKDTNSHFILYNKAIAEYWGDKCQTNLIGKTDFDILPQAAAQNYFDEEQKVMTTNQPLINREGTCSDSTGNLHHFLTTKVPLHDTHGNIAGIVGVNHDITTIKIFETKLLDYQKQLKRLASRLITVEEQERRRIAGEIHDEISQTLAIAKIKLDKLRHSPLPKTIIPEIEEVTRFIEQVIQETRTLTFDLSNPILYELGFEMAVAEWLTENVGEKHGIATELQDDGQPKPLGNDLKATLFRNTRELLTNCIKHASAKNITVKLCRIDDTIQVIVEDNGIGFDPAQLKTTGKKPKFGLFSIRENLENTGGHFEIDSKPGAGCRAIMTAPIESQNDTKEM
jgi:PAS domain S-box-containing protein